MYTALYTPNCNAYGLRFCVSKCKSLQSNLHSSDALAVKTSIIHSTRILLVSFDVHVKVQHDQHDFGPF